jgi:hypothetical protein
MTVVHGVESCGRTRHDELFKGLISSFPYAFLEVFFPWIASEIEVGSLVGLDTHLIDVKDQSSRHADLVYRARLKGSEEEIIIHIEGQAQRVVDYNYAVFIYNSRLMSKYRPRKVVSIVVFGHNLQLVETDRMQISFASLQMVDFRFLPVQLSKINWSEYGEYQNPVSAAMLSKMAFSNDERVDVKLAYTKIISRLDVTPEQLEWVVAYFEAYLRLNLQEEVYFHHRLLEELGQEEVEKVMRALSSYRLEGIEEGIEKGKRLGWEEGERVGIEKGERVGIEKGERVGIEKGERVGIEKGERIGVEKMVLSLLELKTIQFWDIVQASGLSFEEVEVLSKKKH